MKTVKHTLTADTLIVRPGIAYKGKAGEEVEWPADIISVAQARQAKPIATPAAAVKKKGGRRGRKAKAPI